MRHFPEECVCVDGDSDSQMIEEGRTLSVSCPAGASSRAALTQEAGLGWSRHGVRPKCYRSALGPGVGGQADQSGQPAWGDVRRAFLSCCRLSWNFWEEAALQSNTSEKCAILCSSRTWPPHRDGRPRGEWAERQLTFCLWPCPPGASGALA